MNPLIGAIHLMEIFTASETTVYRPCQLQFVLDKNGSQLEITELSKSQNTNYKT